MRHQRRPHTMQALRVARNRRVSSWAASVPRGPYRPSWAHPLDCSSFSTTWGALNKIAVPHETSCYRSCAWLVYAGCCTPAVFREVTRELHTPHRASPVREYRFCEGISFLENTNHHPLLPPCTCVSVTLMSSSCRWSLLPDARPCSRLLACEG